jgi:hypothetical protein
MTDRRRKLNASRDRSFLAKVIKSGSIHKDELTDSELEQAQRLHRAGCIKEWPRLIMSPMWHKLRYCRVTVRSFREQGSSR